MAKKDFIALGRHRARDPLEVYIATHPEVDNTPWAKEVKSALEYSYTNGDTEADQVDAD